MLRAGVMSTLFYGIERNKAIRKTQLFRILLRSFLSALAIMMRQITFNITQVSFTYIPPSCPG